MWVTRSRAKSTSAGRHRRTPYYIRGKQGVIERICGAFPNPEELAYGFDGKPRKVLYRVRFPQQPRLAGCAATHDTIDMEIFEHWLRFRGRESAAAREGIGHEQHPIRLLRSRKNTRTITPTTITTTTRRQASKMKARLPNMKS